MCAVKAIVYTGQGSSPGAFTSLGAFLAWPYQISEHPEMGIICGSALLVFLIPMMTMLFPGIALQRSVQNVIDHAEGNVAERARSHRKSLAPKTRAVDLITVVRFALAATMIRRGYFDYDLLHMQHRQWVASLGIRKKIFSPIADSISVSRRCGLHHSIREAASMMSRLTICRCRSR